jgi:hypothetical protein
MGSDPDTFEKPRCQRGCKLLILRGEICRSEGSEYICFSKWSIPSKELSTVELGSERFPVRSTPKRRLRQVDFVFDGNEIRGLEQNPQTKSRWAQMARSGKK